MGRKRYVSSDICTDRVVRELAEESGEFAVILYTWMITQSADDSTITSDPDELLMLVIPGFRWRTIDDVATAVAGMIRLGLLIDAGNGRLRFPEEAFYKYQTYVKPDRRWPNVGLPVIATDTSEVVTEPLSRSVKIREFPGKSAVSPVSLELSGKDSASHSHSHSGTHSVKEATTTSTLPEDSGSERDEVDEIYSLFKARIQPRSRLCPRKKILARRKRFSVDELRLGIEHFAGDSWWMENNSARGADWFFDSDKRSEQFLLLEPRPAPQANGKNGGLSNLANGTNGKVHSERWGKEMTDLARDRDIIPIRGIDISVDDLLEEEVPEQAEAASIPPAEPVGVVELNADMVDEEVAF